MKLRAQHDVELAALTTTPVAPGGVLLGWLGQAGFVLLAATTTVVIDPYLSDSLAQKYQGKKFPHTRMMPPPIAPPALTHVDVVLCTHAHTDHMDPQTLPVLAQVNPQARFVAPIAERAQAIARGIPADRLVAMNAGETQTLPPGLRVRAVAAAHEELRTDARGNHHYLGYVLELGGARIYHSGDCIPYPGLHEELASLHIDLALLPVNGRDEQRRASGVPGNFTFTEAARLCLDAGIGCMIPCHFGMFDFNTVSETFIDEQIAALPASLQCVRPASGVVYGFHLGKGP